MNLITISSAVACLLAFGIPAGAADDRPSIDFFEARIRPLLTDHCYACHSAGKPVQGALRLDQRAGWEKGGKSGPSIVRGQPDQSLLIKTVRHVGKDSPTSPKHQTLNSEQIALLEEWVRIGAPDPRTETASPDRQSPALAKTHWAFQPITNPTAPSSNNSRWGLNEIDAFVAKAHTDHQLTPSPRADARTLSRRVFNDVIGLPPTPAEVAAFERDPSPKAFARLVDDLLARPQYGERWARHWLDVARYADTKGYVFEEERKYAFAYTYRDYTVQAFNDDKPFDRFVIEQLAADQLALGDDQRPLAAMGFLTLGRRFLNNEQDIIDDRIDVTTRGLMGLTVACARCHDHKFDPVPTADYYSLYGVFASSHEPGEKPLLGVQPPQYEAYLVEHTKRMKERDDFVADTNAALRRKLNESVSDYLLAAQDATRLGENDKRETLAKSRSLDNGVLGRWMKSLETWAGESNAVFFAWHQLRAGATNKETEITGRYQVLIATHAATPALVPVHPLVWRALTNAAPRTLEDTAQAYGTLFASLSEEWQKLAKDAGTNAPPTALPDPEREQLRQTLAGNGGPLQLEDGALRRMYNVEQGQKSRTLQRKVEELDATHPGAPPRAMALLDNTTATEPRIFKRGQPGNPGDLVKRQFLAVIEGPERKPFTKGSGRLELAQAIASTNNPLTARVLVNRVWAQFFDTPLVNTPSDFGVRSDPPSNPGLLDHLAFRFMHEGWSLKKLHRHILTSAVYQQSSSDQPHNRALDQGNRYYWRQNRKRLDFEAMRDSLLTIAGNLNPAIGGQAVDIDSANFAPRRSIYGFIDRQNLPGMFRTFDLASPDTTSPQRFSTTVPQQALFLMNSPFIARQSREVVSRLKANTNAFDIAMVGELYGRIYQREPSREEVGIARAFLERELTRPLPEPTPPDWQYGFGELDEAAGRVRSFTALTNFKDNQWQVSATLPDATHGWVMLNQNGGHPGNDLTHAAIRRWIAPADGTVSIRGKLKHDAEPGDGVRATVISSRDGRVGEWTAHKSEAETLIKSLLVTKGDIIDLVVDCRTGPNSDGFEWKATVRYEREGSESTEVPRQEWSTAKQFTGPVERMAPLNAWERYAQALLVSNEVFFID